MWLQAAAVRERCGVVEDRETGTAAGMNEVDSCTVDTARRVWRRDGRDDACLTSSNFRIVGREVRGELEGARRA